jgi:hypothetical protein
VLNIRDVIAIKALESSAFTACTVGVRGMTWSSNPAGQAWPLDGAECGGGGGGGGRRGRVWHDGDPCRVGTSETPEGMCDRRGLLWIGGGGGLLTWLATHLQPGG